MPFNAIGEIYITCASTSRGYLNRDELNKQRFLPNPYQTKKEKKEGRNALMYKTGDLARQSSNGYLEYYDLLPIPDSERSLNPNLDQNPGW